MQCELGVVAVFIFMCETMAKDLHCLCHCQNVYLPGCMSYHPFGIALFECSELVTKDCKTCLL